MPPRQIKERTHHWVCVLQGAHVPFAPERRAGRSQEPEIQVGHIKQMARTLGILECAKKQIEALR